MFSNVRNGVDGVGTVLADGDAELGVKFGIGFDADWITVIGTQIVEGSVFDALRAPVICLFLVFPFHCGSLYACSFAC
jgi:hypothetical protein